MKVSFDELKDQLGRVLRQNGFSNSRADLCATIFAGNSRDGVHSHGLNRFPTFIQYVKDGNIHVDAEPQVVHAFGCMEQWNGQLAPGVYIASQAVMRAAELAHQHGLGCVAVNNSNHWMRGGTYGWMAADQGCIAICGTNSIANMPPYGGKEPTLGNNPLVIAVPRNQGHLVLDMAMSQFSYGKLNEYKLRHSELPVPGGYDQQGNVSRDPRSIIESQRTLPIGFWKGSGLSLMMDVLVSVLSNGKNVGAITAQGTETGVSQFFICIHPRHINESIIEEVIAFAKSSAPVDQHSTVRYPGEQTLEHRRKSEREGVEVNDEIWEKVKNM